MTATQLLSPPPASTATAPSSPQRPVIATAEEPRYSIRLAEDPDALCAKCEKPAGGGPVGFLGEAPVCDLCLLEGCHDLGMVLLLVAVIRAFGSVEGGSEQERRLALGDLAAFARVYEIFAIKTAPARSALLNEWLARR